MKTTVPTGARYLRPGRIYRDAFVYYTNAEPARAHRRQIQRLVAGLKRAGGLGEGITGYFLDVMDDEDNLLDTISITTGAFHWLKWEWGFTRDRSAEYVRARMRRRARARR